MRCLGKLAGLEAMVDARDARGYARHRPHPLGHARPSERGQRPPAQGRQRPVVHNGIIENYLRCGRALEAAGRKFASETDTEIVAPPD